MNVTKVTPLSLRSWLWRSYLRTAVEPLFAFGMIVVVIHQFGSTLPTVAGAAASYVIYLLLIRRRARLMSDRITASLNAISWTIDGIGQGDYQRRTGGNGITELDLAERRLVETGDRLNDAINKIVAQERVVTRALMRQKQVNEEQARFIRTISHELRTPLAVIDSSAQIIDRKATDIQPAELRSRMIKLRRAVDRISTLLLNFFESSALESKEFDAEFSQASLRVLIADTAKQVVSEDRIRLIIPELHVENVVVEDGPTVAIALRALLDNAVLYSPAGSTVTVTLHIANAIADIKVANSGLGIAADEAEFIGTRYFRGRASIGTSGVGISIHIARKLLDRIGGEITFTSETDSTIATLCVPIHFKPEAKWKSGPIT